MNKGFGKKRCGAGKKEKPVLQTIKNLKEELTTKDAPNGKSGRPRPLERGNKCNKNALIRKLQFCVHRRSRLSRGMRDCPLGNYKNGGADRVRWVKKNEGGVSGKNLHCKRWSDARGKKDGEKTRGGRRGRKKQVKKQKLGVMLAKAISGKKCKGSLGWVFGEN